MTSGKTIAVTIQTVDSKVQEKSREIAPEGRKRLSQSGNNAQLWMCLVMKVKSKAVKNNIA